MKKLLFVQSKPPHGSLQGQEGLDAILAGSAFVDCAVLFTGDGVYQLLSQQHTDALSSRDYAATYLALEDYGVDQLYCVAADLQQRGLTTADLLLSPTPLDDAGVQALLHRADAILDF
jgi:tRNA 2-thiouridine synthesizing protein C